MTAQWQVTEETTADGATAATAVVTNESVIDWDAAPAYDEPVEVAAPVSPPRGRWDFTDGQRIVLSVLIWLNIIVLIIGIQVVVGGLML